MTVQASCEHCGGTIKMEPDAIRLRVAPSGQKGVYSFACPKCSAMTVGIANHDEVKGLMLEGVKPVKREDASVRISCPQCGEGDVQAKDMEVKVSSQESGGIYRFICPVCTALVEKKTDQRFIDLLLSVGVPKDPATPLTYDDLIDFHFRYQRMGDEELRAAFGLT